MRPLSPTRRLILSGCAVALGGEGWWFLETERRDRRDAAEAPLLRAASERRTGFRIVTDGLQAHIGPSVIQPDRPVTLADLGPHRIKPLRSLASALPPYPPGFLARLLDTVVLAGDVTFWHDTEVGGFYFPLGVCLNAGSAADVGPFTTRLFHHELSSLVRAAVPFDAARWQALNPPGFRYLNEAAYRRLLRDKPHAEGDPTFWRQGFVRPYGMSDIDNDFNTYAESALSDGPAFAALIRPWPIMRAKTAMMVATYAALDRQFTGVFASMGFSGSENGA